MRSGCLREMIGRGGLHERFTDDSVIHEGSARSGAMPDEADLQRRGPEREDLRPCSLRVHSEVRKDFDLVVPDDLGNRRIAASLQEANLVKSLVNPGASLMPRLQRVTDDVEVRSVVGREDALKVPPDGVMHLKIR